MFSSEYFFMFNNLSPEIFALINRAEVEENAHEKLFEKCHWSMDLALCKYSC